MKPRRHALLVPNIGILTGAIIAGLLLASLTLYRGLEFRGIRSQTVPAMKGLKSALVRGTHLEGRLVGGFDPPEANTKGTRRSSQVNLPAELLLEVAKVELEARRLDAAAADAPLAIASFAKGDIDAALHLLDLALDYEGQNAALWSDGAAIYLTASTQHDRPELAVRALAAAGQALALQPDLREAKFNRALALEAVGLTDQALAAWQDYQNVPDPWRMQAIARENALRADLAGDDQWPSLANQLTFGSNGKHRPSIEPASFVAFRQQLREWIEEELLDQWGHAVLVGDTRNADRALEMARKAAEMLILAQGDDQPLQGIRAIDTVREPGVLKRLAEAHVALADVIRLFDEGAVSSALSRFRNARRAFALTGSSYAEWTVIYESVALYADRQLGRAFDVASANIPTGPGRNLQYLRGRQAWLKGLIRLHQGQLSDALKYYREGLQSFESVGERDSAAAMSSLVAESLFALGERSAAWKHQRDAVRHARGLKVARRRHLILLTAGLMCIDDEVPRAALEFQDAVLDGASSADSRPSSILNAYLQRSRNKHALGDSVGASADLEKARQQLPMVQDALLRERNTAEIWAATALVQGETAPAEATDAATRAIEYFGRQDGQLFLPGLFLARARAERKAGLPSQAEADASRAIAAFERQREAVVEQEHRATLFQDGWNAYEALIGLRVAGGDIRGALELAERSRARTLLEDLVGQRDASPAPLADLQPALPRGAAALYFVSRPDRLWIWVVTPADVRFFDRPVPATVLRRTVERVRYALAGDHSLQSPGPALRDLFGALIGPVWDEIVAFPTLIVVPDGALHTLPFAALQNPVTGKYLIETHVIVMAPSLNVLARASQSRPSGVGQALVVANTQHVTALGIDLPQLRDARAEAVAIAGLYGARAELLVDDDATKLAFKSRLPDADVVHYAGHALSDARMPERSRLFLGGGSRVADPAMYASELSEIRLTRRPVVVLASCSTHAGRIAVAEGVQSLARPFLGAGASAVVATLWDIRDDDAGQLFTAFHQHLSRGETAAQALASVQRAAIARDSSIEAVAGWSWPVSIGGILQ